MYMLVVLYYVLLISLKNLGFFIFKINSFVNNSQVGFYIEMMMVMFVMLFCFMYEYIVFKFMGLDKLYLYGGYFVFDFYVFMVVFFLLVLFLGILLMFNMENVNFNSLFHKLEGFEEISDIMFYLSFGFLGGLLLFFSNSFMLIMLSVEIMSFSTYVLIIMNRSSSVGLEAGVQYFLLSGLFSCVMFFGFVLLYYFVGSMFLSDMQVLLVDDFSFYVGYFLVFFGLFFKLGMAPFHKWMGLVYDNVSMIIMVWLSVFVKYMYMIFFFKLFFYLVYFMGNCSYIFSHMIYVLGGFSLILGSFLGLVEVSMKRLVAWSSVINLGYMLLVLGNVSYLGFEIFVFYFMQYVLCIFNLLLMMVMLGMSRNSRVGLDMNLNGVYFSSPMGYMSQLRGEFLYNKVLIFCLCVSLLSMGGMPPFLGFYGKQMVFYVLLVDGQYFWIVLSVFVAMISMVYYLRIMKMILLNVDSDFYGVYQDTGNILGFGMCGYFVSFLSVFMVFFMLECDMLYKSMVSYFFLLV